MPPSTDASSIKMHLGSGTFRDQSEEQGPCVVIPALRLALLLANRYTTAKIVAFVASEVGYPSRDTFMKAIHYKHSFAGLQA